MNLTEMFYGTFVPPVVTSIRTHKLGFSSLPSYVPLKYHKAVDDNRTFEEKLSKSGKLVLKILRSQVNPITGCEMADKTPFTKNYCSVLLGTFVKEGLAKRTKVKKPNTYVYAYTAVKND